MAQLYEALHGKIIQLTNTYSRTNKPLSLKDLTATISTISSVYDQQMLNLPSKFICSINEALEGLLNNLSALVDANQTTKEVKDRMDMFHQLLSIILNRYDSKGDTGLLFRFIEFSLKQLKPCLSSLKPKQLNEVLNTISCSKTNSPICPFPKSKVLLKHYVTSLLFQLLHKNKYQKIEQVLHEYLAASEDMKMGEFQSYLLSWIGIYGMKECYMGYRVLGGIFEAYLKGFSASYAKDAKYISTKYDPKILGIMIRSLNSFMNDVSIVENVNCESEQAGCNICTHIATNPHTYYLQICDSIYTINLCKSCKIHLTAQNNFTSDMMIQLALTCEPIHNDKQMQGLREVIGIDSGVFCEINSELRLVKDKLLRCGMCARNIGKCLPNLWAALMILANHNDSAVRSKALKVIIQTYTPTENETKQSKMLLQKINKCIANRVLDTDEKVRHAALSGIIMLQDLDSALRIVDRQFADGIGGTTMMVGEIAEKLITRVTAKKGGIKQNQIICFMEVMARLGLVHASRSKSSKTKKTRSSNSIPTAISLLTPHLPQLQSLLKPHNKSQNLQIQLCASILFPQKQISSQIYTTMIQMLREMSKDRLGIWLHQSEMIDMVINNVVQGKKFDGIGNLWLLRIIVSYKQFLIVERLIQRIIEVSSSSGFARQSQQYSVCMSLCKLLQYIVCVDLVELKQWLFKHKKDLQRLWKCIIHNVLPEIGREGQDEQDVAGLCRLLGEIDRKLKNLHQTMDVYFNCCDFILQTLGDVSEQHEINSHNKQNDKSTVTNINNHNNPDQTTNNQPLQIGLTLQTIKICLFLLPQISHNIRELNQQIEFDSHTKLLHDSIKAILNHLLSKSQQAPKIFKSLQQQESLDYVKGNTYGNKNTNQGDSQNEQKFILESGKLLVRLWSLVPEYLEEDEEKMLQFIQMSNIKLNDILLMGIYSIICSSSKIGQLEKTRDLFMSIMHQIPLLPSFKPILQNLPFYLIIKQLVSKGLLTYLHVGKNIIYGLCGYGGQESDIARVCGQIIKEVGGDLVESRQLFANFGETIKFIVAMEELSATHMLYLITSSCYLPTLPNLILSKHQQSLESLKPTIHKSFCEHLNKLVTSGRIMISSVQNTSQLFLVMNSILKCHFIHLDDYRAVMNCLIAVVDSIYLQITVGSRGTGAEVHLWSVLKGLVYLGQGYPARQACREAEKLFVIKNQIIQIQSTNNINLEKVPLLEIFEEINQLHEATLYGYQPINEEEQNDEFSTYDTSNQTDRKLLKGYKQNAKIKLATKAKINARKGQKGNFKKTKKTIQNMRSKSSPKIQQNWEEVSVDSVDVCVENLQYKKKLRNKGKMVF